MKTRKKRREGIHAVNLKKKHFIVININEVSDCTTQYQAQERIKPDSLKQGLSVSPLYHQLRRATGSKRSDVNNDLPFPRLTLPDRTIDADPGASKNRIGWDCFALVMHCAVSASRHVCPPDHGTSVLVGQIS